MYICKLETYIHYSWPFVLENYVHEQVQFAQGF
jgi:hypothetical protein